MENKLRAYHVGRPLTAEQAERALERAANAFPELADAFPQEADLEERYWQVPLPPLTEPSGVEMAWLLSMIVEFDQGQPSPEVLAGIVDGFKEILGQQDRFSVSRSVCLAPAVGAKGRRRVGSVSLEVQGGEAYLALDTGGFLLPHDPGERTRYCAEERRVRRDLFARFIRAARLPVKIVREGKSFGFFHTVGWGVNSDRPEEHGPLTAAFMLRGAGGADLVERFDAAGAALGGFSDFSLSGILWVPGSGRTDDQCRRVYDHVRASCWPAQSWEVTTLLRVSSVAALDALRPSLPTARSSLKLPLGQVPLPKRPGQGHSSATLSLTTRRDGHRLCLRVAATHATAVPGLGRKLGVTFQP